MATSTRKWWICNSCQRRNCRRKPDATGPDAVAACSMYTTRRPGWKMIDHLMNRDPANTLKLLHEFGLGVTQTNKGFKTYVK